MHSERFGDVSIIFFRSENAGNKRKERRRGGDKVDEASGTPRMITADVPGRGRMYYLVDSKYDFIPEAKEFLDWKAA